MSVVDWGDGKISGEIANELRADNKLKTYVIEQVLSGKHVDISSTLFSSELNILFQIESEKKNKSRIVRCLETAIEEIFSSVYTIDTWIDLVREGKVNVLLDGVSYHDIKYNEDISTYSKITEDNYLNALYFFIKDIAIEKRKLVSIIEIEDCVNEQLDKITNAMKSSISRKTIRGVIADVLNDKDVRKIIRKLCFMHGRANRRIEFEPEQIDEMGYYLKGKFYIKRVEFSGKLSSMIMLWSEIPTSTKTHDFTPKMFQLDVLGHLVYREVEDLCNCKRNTKAEVLQKCKDIGDIVSDTQVFQDISIQLLNNTYFDLEKCKPMKEIDPDKYFVTLHMPVTYDPLARCPNLHQYIINAVTVEGDRYKTKVSILHVWETLSWIVFNNLNLGRGVFYIGQIGNNGKSVLLNWQESFTGKPNISTVPIEDIGDDRFATADIFGKKLNQNADIDGTRITRTGTFKKLMTRDSMRAQNKGQPAFDFRPYCVNVWSVNDPPEFAEKNDSIWKRLLPIEFPNKFENNPTDEQKKNGVKKIDRELVKNMSSEEEKSGAFNICMGIGKRLRKNQTFSYEPSNDEIRDYWEGVSNHLIGFSKNMLEKVEDGFVIGSDLEESYTTWCYERRRQHLKHGDFNREFQKDCVYHTEYLKESNRANGKWVWRGVWFINKPFPIDDKGKPIFTCQQCKMGKHDDCRHNIMLKGDSMLRCKCSNNKHSDTSIQTTLYKDSNDKPMMACKNCTVKNHDDCLDELNCLCGSKGHPKNL